MAETMVLHDDDHHDNGDAAAAVAHGMLSTVAEVLDRLDERLSALEDRVARPDTRALEARIDTVVTSVTNSLADAIAGEVRSALTAARADATQGVARLADLLADRALPEPAPTSAPPPPVLDEGALGALLDERLAAVTAGIAGLLADHDEASTLRSLARNLARVEAELAEARAESAMAMQTVAERLERVVTDALVEPAPAVAERLAVLEATTAEARTHGEEVLRRAVGAVEAMVANAARIEAAVAEPRKGRKDKDRDRDRDRDGDPDLQAEAITRLADRLSQLQEAVNRSRGETVAAVDRLAGELDERLASARLTSDTTGSLDDLGPRLARLEAALGSLHEQQEARGTALVSELQSVVGSGMERLLTHAASGEEVLASDVRAALHRLTEVAASVESVSATVAGVADTVTRLAADDRTRPVLAALENASREHQEGLATLHSAVVRRIDGRMSAVARALDGIGDIGPVLQRVAASVDDDEARSKELLAGVRGTAEAVERAINSLRDDLAQEVGGLAKRQTSALRLLERVGAALDDEQRRLEGVQALCQSVAGAVEQQAAVGSRVADLVMETRSGVRSELERLESTVQLEGAKRQQQDQARLSQMAAGVTEVVERETALVAQRVASLGSAVESLRNALHAHLDEGVRA